MATMVDIIEWNHVSEKLPILEKESIQVLIIGGTGVVNVCDYVNPQETLVKDFDPKNCEIITIDDMDGCFAFTYTGYYVRIKDVKYWAYLPEDKIF